MVLCFLVCLINIFGVRYFGECKFRRFFPKGYNSVRYVSAEFVFSIIKRMFFLLTFLAVLTFCIVTLITGLIFCGLIVDLGGGPDHKRLGFQVCKSLEFSFQRPDLDV